ncbi:type IV pilus biogenesis protein PilP [Pseudomonas protegens]|uniref:Type IV pilus biogenesis protein PilP n=1 Tax=Pseudomonas protegens TaxID=380021 RepID=A0A2T6GBF3_9PSED|nr:type IV pilus biogenesis protein PilP [Pseudomonas protegens]PUA41488.1 type IV pilus biogenesis protein PilP [Pseudomonas protegens]
MRTREWWWGLLVLLSGLVMAAEEGAAPVLPGQTLLQLEQIQAETVLLEAQAARAKAKKELEEGTSGGSGLPMLESSGASLPARPLGRVHVQEIYGAGNRLVARLGLPDGSQVEIVPGEAIPGTDLTVTAISARSVRVSGGEGERVLPFN